MTDEREACLGCVLITRLLEQRRQMSELLENAVLSCQLYEQGTDKLMFFTHADAKIQARLYREVIGRIDWILSECPTRDFWSFKP